MDNRASFLKPILNVKNEFVSISWLELFSGLKSPSQRLALMDQLMDRLVSLQEVVFDDAPITYESKSHKKRLMFSQVVNGSHLNVEWIEFSGASFTGAHTHPELICDHILRGSLLEQAYHFADDLYHLGSAEVRQSGDRRLVADKDGLPHNVRAQEGPCVTICISYGQPLRMISDHEICK